MALVQRSCSHSELRIIARDDRRTLAEAWMDDGLNG